MRRLAAGETKPDVPDAIRSDIGNAAPTPGRVARFGGIR
jgi:hypothetical protein